MSEHQKKYVTIYDVATYTSLSIRQINRLMKDGLPSFKIGGSRRFKLEDVDEFIAANASAGPVAGTSVRPSAVVSELPPSTRRGPMRRRAG